MTSLDLKQILRDNAVKYAKSRALAIDESHHTAVIFKNLGDNFHPASFREISQNEAWLLRTSKEHGQVVGRCEMQSSNSSDALLMNVFCHPSAGQWKGLRDILKVSVINPNYGFKAGVLKLGQPDRTDIDMVLENTLFEAKLTEEDFTAKPASVVEQYDGLTEHFHKECLAREGDRYCDYQAIRGLLAAIQHYKNHVLLCDERRPDLVRRYMETVCCLKDPQARKKCRVVFWQELKQACGHELGCFLEEKYGI